MAKLTWQDQQVIEKNAAAIMRTVNEAGSKGDEHDPQIKEIERLAQGILSRVSEKGE